MNAQHVTSANETKERLATLHDAYAEKVSTAVAAGRDKLVRELADAYETESAQLTGAHTLERRPARRTLWARFDRYTLQVMNPSHPYRRTPDRPI